MKEKIMQLKAIILSRDKSSLCETMFVHEFIASQLKNINFILFSNDSK